MPSISKGNIKEGKTQRNLQKGKIYSRQNNNNNNDNDDNNNDNDNDNDNPSKQNTAFY